MDKVEVRAVIKHFCKKGMSPKKIHDDFIKTFGDESPYSMMKKWAPEFRRGRQSVEDYERSRCPKEAFIDENVERTVGSCVTEEACMIKLNKLT